MVVEYVTTRPGKSALFHAFNIRLNKRNRLLDVQVKGSHFYLSL